MPALTRRYLKTALLYLIASLLLGAALRLQDAGWVAGIPGSLHAVYYHLFTVGWLTQLIFGIAWWMFPTLSKERPRGSERTAAGVYFGLNAGLLLRTVAEPLQATRPGPWPAALLVLSAVLQTGAAWAFTALIWPRVRGPRSQAS